MNIQQKQAFDYFDSHAGDWKQKAVGKKNAVNVIRERNDYVLKIVKGSNAIEKVLDVGCGTGDLVCEIAGLGLIGVGVDFSKEMIEVAKASALKLKNNTARFECCSIFGFKTGKEEFGLVSANGFIEYISYKELDALFDLAFIALKPGGFLVLGSRNRLFNMFSLNDFTKDEVSEGNAPLLLLEAIKVSKCRNPKSLLGLKTVGLQKENKKHYKTGIGVRTRYQFTPPQLVQMAKAKGFRAIDIFPIHSHYGSKLLAFASSFMICLKKEKKVVKK